VKDKPFYMNYWMFSVHAPFDAKEELIEKYRGKIDPNAQRSPTYAAMVESTDDAVGTLMDAIEEAGLTDKTIFIFSSDNGGNMYNGIRETGKDGESFVVAPTSNAPLRGGKATIYEGGIRVPTVIAWPGLTAKAAMSAEIIQCIDFYPTLIKGLGLPCRKTTSSMASTSLPPSAAGNSTARPSSTSSPTIHSSRLAATFGLRPLRRLEAHPPLPPRRSRRPRLPTLRSRQRYRGSHRPLQRQARKSPRTGRPHHRSPRRNQSRRPDSQPAF
jgi:arylsulfatase A-like enzyme